MHSHLRFPQEAPPQPRRHKPPYDSPTANPHMTPQCRTIQFFLSGWVIFCPKRRLSSSLNLPLTTDGLVINPQVPGGPAPAAHATHECKPSPVYLHSELRRVSEQPLGGSVTAGWVCLLISAGTVLARASFLCGNLYVTQRSAWK